MAESTTIPNLDPVLSLKSSAMIWVNQDGADFRSTVGAAVSVGVLNQAPTGAFFENAGGVVNRINDRLFVGAATLNDGNFSSPNQDWLSQFQAGIGDFPWISLSQQAVTTQALAVPDMYALTVGAHSASINANNGSAIALSALALNDNATLVTGTWAIYAEGHKTTAASGPAYAAEFEVRNTVASIAITPYTQSVSQTVALQIGSGAGVSATGQFDNSAAINIRGNPVQFRSGIVFGSDAITDLGGGNMRAIELAQNHRIQWFVPVGTAGPYIVSSVVTQANATSVAFGDNGFNVSQNSNAGSLLNIPPVPSVVNFAQITAGATGVGVTLAAAGGDSNVALTLAAKGSGVIGVSSPTRFASTAGFNNTAPIAKPTVTGSKGANAALASLMTALAAYGLVTDSTT